MSHDHLPTRWLATWRLAHAELLHRRSFRVAAGNGDPKVQVSPIRSLAGSGGCDRAPARNTRSEARCAMPSSTREQCLQRAEACDRLAVETMDAHVRETMQFLASRWRALAAEAIASNEESPNGNGS